MTTRTVRWPLWAQYTLALGVVGAAVLVRWLLDPLLGERVPYILVFAVLLMLVVLVRPRAFIAAALFGGAASWFLFIAPHSSPLQDARADALQAGLFAIAVALAGVTAWLAGRAQDRTREARQQAEQQREALRVTLASIGDAVITTDTQGRITFLNSVAQQITGWRSEDAQEKPLSEIFHIVNEETRQRLDNPVSKVLQDGQIVGLANHTLLIRKDGTELPIDDSAAPIRNADGTIAGVVLVFHDITDRRAAEKAIERSRRDLSDFFEQASVGLHWVGPDGTILRANQAELDMLGYTRDEYVGRNIAEFHVDQPVVNDILTRLTRAETLQKYPAQMRCNDGSIRDVLINSNVLFEDGKFVHTRCFTFDITERKRAELNTQFLTDASASLASLVDYESTLQRVASLAVPGFADWCAVDIVDCDSLWRLAVAHIDPAKVELAKEIRRRNPPDRQAGVGGWAIVRSGKSELIEQITDADLAALAPDPEVLDMVRKLGLRSYMAVPLGTHEQVLGVLTFVSAESGRRYTAQDLSVAEDLGRRAAVAIENARLYYEVREADRRKDEFLATLAHELRNPLAPIRSSLEILERADGNDGLARDARGIMRRQLAHMVRLVDDLLDISRITRDRLELRKTSVDLASIVHQAMETAQPMADCNQHRLDVELPEEPIYLNADPVRMAQVFSNLLNNACKFTEPGGRIRLTAERHGNDVVVSVEDNGIGIPPDKLPDVFDMFTQIDGAPNNVQGGLGIGLRLVKRLVEMHDGAVTAHSEGPGRGSEFVVRLPARDVSSYEMASAPAAAAEQTTGRRILVVDDNRDAAETLATLLGIAGNETHLAYDGSAAIEAAEKIKPDVVLLDIGLPKMSGYEVARSLRAKPWGRSMVLVALTGWGQEEDRRRSLDAGFDAHLVKPVDNDQLLAVLATARRALH